MTSDPPELERTRVMANPLREPTKLLIEQSRTARLAFLLAAWPFVYASDWWQRIYPRARFRDGLAWVGKAPHL